MLVSVSLLFWVCSAQAQSQQELASIAAEAMKKQDYEKAEKCYEKLIHVAPDVAEIYSNLGLARYFLKKSELATEAFEKALRRQPALFVPNFFLGKIHFEQQRYPKALPLLQKAAQVQPREKTARQLLAATLVALKRLHDAVAEYEKLLKETPDHVEVLYSLGLVYLELGRKAFDQLADFKRSGFFSLVIAETYAAKPGWQDVALTNYRQAVIASPMVPGLRVALGMFLLRREEWDSAKDVFEEELKLDPFSYEALFGLSFCRLLKGDLRSALREVNEAVRIRPEFFAPLPPLPVGLNLEASTLDYSYLEREAKEGTFGAAYLLTQLSAGLHRESEAVRWRSLAERRRNELINNHLSAAETVGELSENDRRAVGLQHLHQKRYENGLGMLFPLVPKFRRDSEVGTVLVRALYRLERFKDLISLVEQLELNDPEIFYHLGSTYKNLALQTMGRMVEVNPESAQAHGLLGDALYEQQLFREAAEEYEAAVKIQPRNSELLFSLGNAYFNELKFERAEQVYGRTLELDAFHAEAHLMRGSALIRLGRSQEAIPLLRRALELNSELTRAHAFLGTALATLGSNEEAVKHLELATATDEDGSTHYQLFSLYRKLGQDEKAAEALRISEKLRAGKERQ